MTDPATSSAPRRGTTDPRRSRLHALKVLFQADLRGQDPLAALAAISDDDRAMALLGDADADDDEAADGPAIDDYAATLVRGVAEHRDDLDGIIERFARRWTIGRMPVVDRNVLRLGAFELLHETDLPPAVVIDEAVELAKDLSTDNSARFVNGVLESIRQWHQSGTPDAS